MQGYPQLLASPSLHPLSVIYVFSPAELQGPIPFVIFTPLCRVILVN